MAAHFLLRFQERYLYSVEVGRMLTGATVTKVHGEQPDRSAMPGVPMAIVAASGTETRIRGESPDRSSNGHAGLVLPPEPEVSVNETLTYTYVRAEAPRNDDKRQTAGRVLFPCY